jgi:hypothetical protein
MPIPVYPVGALAVRIADAMERRVSCEPSRTAATRQTLLTLAIRVAPCILGEGSHDRPQPSQLAEHAAWWRVGPRSTRPTRHQPYDHNLRSARQRGNCEC